jgi:hypothetical protein
MLKTEKLIDDLKMFYGLPPHNDCMNLVYGDPYFKVWIERKYGKSVEELAKQVGLFERSDKQ